MTLAKAIELCPEEVSYRTDYIPALKMGGGCLHLSVLHNLVTLFRERYLNEGTI